jgi:hypothetical protein
MKFVFRGLVAFFCLLLVMHFTAKLLPDTKPVAVAAAPAQLLPTAAIQETGPPFSAQVMAQIGRQSPKWQEIRFDNDNSAKMVALTINYRRTPSGYGEVEADTRRVARAVLRTLVANGRNPHAEWIFVSVRGQKPESGETGADLVRVFGTTRYDFNSDQLVFEAAQ